MKYSSPKKPFSFFFWMVGLFLVLLVTLCLIPEENHHKETFNTKSSDNITIVSGYWEVPNKYGKEKYNEWFRNTLKINQRMIFFCDPKDMEYIKSFRNGYETIFIDYPMENFLTNQYASDNWIHPMNSPSKELSMVWNEKMNLMKLAKDYDLERTQTTDFYMWIDAGICTYRNQEPPQHRLNLKDINSLPPNKITYTEVMDSNQESVFTGGCFVIHRDMIDMIHTLYYQELEKCISTENNHKCGIDQLIFTEIKKQSPELFHVLGHDYGENVKIIYNEYT